MHSVGSRLRSPVLRYALAVSLAGLAVVGRWKFGPAAGQSIPFFLLLLSVLVATRWGGVGPGLAAAAVNTAAVIFVFLIPREGGRGSSEVLLRTAVFVAESAAVVALVGVAQTTRARAEGLARRIRRSYDVSAALGKTHTAHEAADVVLHEVARTLDGEVPAVFIASEPGVLRQLAYLPGAYATEVAAEYKEVPLDGATIIAYAARNRTTVFVEGEKQWRERFPESYAKFPAHPKLRALFCAPMVVGDRLIGVLVAGFARSRRFSEDDRLWVQAVAQECGKALDRARLLETEERAHAEAQAASRAKDELLALVSYELREPLGSIAAWIDVLRQNAGDRALCDRGSEVIGNSVQAQAQLIDGLLDLSRTVARRLKVEMEQHVDLLQLVRSSVDPLRVEAAADGVHLQTGSLVEVRVVADADRLGYVLREFVASAIQSTPPGGHVRVESEIREGRAFVSVQDEGRGMERGALDRAFDVDSKTPGCQCGSTGLAIAQYIVEEHGGALHIDSPGRDRGTTLIIELPMDESDAISSEASSNASQKAPV
jgi:K+-sensing histidine kinase KdpD